MKAREAGAPRRLQLSRETVRELDDSGLREAAGGLALNTVNVKCVLSITSCECTGNYTMNALCQ